MNILLISDIHANFTALSAIVTFLKKTSIDLIINGGDSIVYGPFPNETLQWLRDNHAHSILGNTDKKVIRLLKGKNFKKPRSVEKRQMYTWTAEHLKAKNQRYLLSLPTSQSLYLPMPCEQTKEQQLDMYHGSPAKDHEFLFADTPDERFEQLASLTPATIVVVGHSHTPFHKYLGATHFINPGSVGRMFDGNPQTSFALLTVSNNRICVRHHRLPYDMKSLFNALETHHFPNIYSTMYRMGRKLN